jgi:hypothetical protein
MERIRNWENSKQQKPLEFSQKKCEKNTIKNIVEKINAGENG